MDFGDVRQPELFSANVLRKAKQEAKEKSYGFTSDDPIQCISYMKHNLPWIGSIHDIGLDRFYVHYWTQTQIFLYKEYVKKSECSRVCINATGSLVKKVKHSKSNLSSHILLYEVVINDGNNQFSVSQMLSERHDTLSIAFWLGQ